MHRIGHSHAIYNATEKPVQWMNINVTAMRGTYDNFDLRDDRVGAALDPIPVFMTMRLDRALLRPMAGLGGGKGTVQYRRALRPLGVPHSLGVCRSPVASAPAHGRSPRASRVGGGLLCNEWPRRHHRLAGQHGNSSAHQPRNGADSDGRCQSR